MEWNEDAAMEDELRWGSGLPESGRCPGSGEYGNRIDHESATCSYCDHVVKIIKDDELTFRLAVRVCDH